MLPETRWGKAGSSSHGGRNRQLITHILTWRHEGEQARMPLNRKFLLSKPPHIHRHTSFSKASPTNLPQQHHQLELRIQITEPVVNNIIQTSARVLKRMPLLIKTTMRKVRPVSLEAVGFHFKCCKPDSSFLCQCSALYRGRVKS